MLQEDNSLKQNSTHLREVDSVEQSSMSTRQLTCDQQVKLHATEITTNSYFFILLQSESYSSWKTGGSDNLRIITISL